MAVNVNSFKVFTEFVANKAQVGNSVTPSQFNEVANRAQFQLFEKDYQTYIKTNEISEFLQTFLLTKQGSVSSSGVYNVPTDFQHMAECRKYLVVNGSGKMIPVKKISIEEWGDYDVSQLMVPTNRFPKFSEFGNSLKFLPRNLGLIEFDYFRTPVAPVWGFTTTNNRPVYNPATSTNFEWDEFAENAVAAIYLSLIGVNLKDVELSQFSQMYKQETNSIL